MTSLILNCDSQAIKNWEETADGYLKLWLAVGVAGKDLNYDSGRVEYIETNDLIDPESVNTAVGRPITLNHPPMAVNSNNFNKFANGISLQEYAQDGDTVYMASLLWDERLKKGIKDKKLTHTSSAYYATKTPNTDGRIKQSKRRYNHFAILSEEFAPRAGQESKILLLNQDGQMTQQTTQTQTLNVDANEIEARTQLWVDWGSVLKEKGKTIDYNLDSRAIKKAVLSCFYPENVLNQLNVDAVLDGFWLNFTANPNTNNPKQQAPVITTPYTFNQDGADPVQAEIDKYLEKVTGVKKSA